MGNNESNEPQRQSRIKTAMLGTNQHPIQKACLSSDYPDYNQTTILENANVILDLNI